MHTHIEYKNNQIFSNTPFFLLSESAKTPLRMPLPIQRFLTNSIYYTKKLFPLVIKNTNQKEFFCICPLAGFRFLFPIRIIPHPIPLYTSFCGAGWLLCCPSYKKHFQKASHSAYTL